MGARSDTCLVCPAWRHKVTKINKEDWISFFPYSLPRPEQEEAINFILRSFIEDNKRFVIADLGTGIGKSAIGITVARYLEANTLAPPNVQKGAWFLTTQKILQEQYCNDFGGDSGTMREIKSATNYRCAHFKKVSCAEGMQMLKAADKTSKFFKSCMFNCVYKKARKDFLESPESVTNFSYALTAANYGDKIGRRNLLVIDESHNAENELSRFIEITVTDRIAGGLGLAWPEVSTAAQAMKWLRDTYQIEVARVAIEMTRDVEEFKGLEGHEKEYADLSKRCDALRSHSDKLITFLQVYTPDNWVFEQLPPIARSGGKITFKPIDVAPFAEQTLFRLGEKVLMMSATIINSTTFAESLGISPDQCTSITRESPFPVENRPIMVFPIGNMSSAYIDETLPKMVEAIREILKEHKTQKGIVHCIDSEAMIEMSDGSQKRLIDVAEGDNVVTWNEKELKFESSTVAANWDMGTKECINIHMENGEVLSCTPEHRILTSNRGWVQAQDLKIDDNIVDFSR